MMRIEGCILLCLMVLTSGCAVGPTPHYYWGEYEQTVYNSYINTDQSSPEIQLSKLNRDLLAAENSGKPVPPGVYAQIGLAYAQTGDVLNAQVSFEKEMELYPESARFMNQLINNMKQS